MPQLPRATANPFFDGASRDPLQRSGRQTLIIGGFTTEVVVLHAALSAIDCGYTVPVAVDVCGGMSEWTEPAAFRQIEAAGVAMTSVVSIATALAPNFTKSDGR